MAESQREAGLPKVWQHAEFILNELKERGEIKFERFVELCNSDGAGGKETSANALRPDWHHASNAVAATLNFLGYSVDGPGHKSMSATLVTSPFTSDGFNIRAEHDAKVHIGMLVAKFLKDDKLCNQEESVLLGSGTTVFHIGQEMCGKGPYPQLFSTINVALAALWCTNPKPPAKQISIPSGVLETDMFRFGTLQEDREEKSRWTPAVVIVGADGCHYDRATKRIWLYGKSESVAYNTNLYVKSAKTIVLYCLSSRKTNRGNKNTGPRLDPPPKGVVGALVTGVEPLKEKIRSAFELQGYLVIEKETDLGKIGDEREKLAQLEEAEEKLMS